MMLHDRRPALALITLLVWCATALAACSKPATEALAQSFESSDGAAIHYVEKGTGNTLVWIPGWTFSGMVWEEQMDAFAATHRNVVVDPRGQGRTPFKDHPKLFERRAKDLHELLAHLDTEDAILIGWSLGAEELAFMAARYGTERIAALVLVDSDVTNESRGDEETAASRTQEFRQNREAMTQNFNRSMFEGEVPEELLQRLVTDSLSADIEGATRLMTRPRINHGKALRDLDLPILYIGAESNRHLTESLTTTAPSVQTVLLKDVGHALFMEDPEAFNAALNTFLKQMEL